MLDLDSMSKDDLENLLKDVQKALASVEKRRRAEARAAAEEAAKQFGLSLTDVLGGDKGAGKTPRNIAIPTIRTRRGTVAGVNRTGSRNGWRMVKHSKIYASEAPGRNGVELEMT